jgi:hypothetical protein
MNPSTPPGPRSAREAGRTASWMRLPLNRRQNQSFRLLVALLAFSAVTLLVSWAQTPTIATRTPSLTFPKHVGSVLVLVDRLPEKETFVRERAEQVAVGLRYFSMRTSWDYVDTAPLEKIRNAGVIVYLGLNGKKPIAPDAVSRLRAARRLIVSQHHLDELRNAGIAFGDVSGGISVRMPAGTQIAYRDHLFPVTFFEYLGLHVHSPANVVADYVLPDGSRSPYIVADKQSMFVNGELSFMVGNRLHGSMLTACDAIAYFLGVTPNPKPLAMLRLEDVSSITSAWNMGVIARYLWKAHVPYGIGVIPDLQTREGYGGPLRDNMMLVWVLQWAQAHGAVIILHGLHHCCSALDAEGYEFWDVDHNTPIADDSADRMRRAIRTGLNEETALGLHPVIWETPHYSASPTDYNVVSEFFPIAWEPRRPVGWLPWALQRDQFGATILPENLGFITNDRSRSVTDQLSAAQDMQACRYCVAAGFIHPATIPVQDVAAYVDGLRKLGYEFADPAQATPSKSND